MSFIKVIGAPIVDFNEGDKIEDVIAKIVANEKNLYLQMIEICKFLDAVYATDGDMKADFSATLNIGSIVNVTVKYNKLFIKYKTDDGKEDVIVYQLHVSESDEGGTPVQAEEKSIIIIPVLWGTLADLPQRQGAPGRLWRLGEYWYDTENEVLKVCTNDTIYQYEFEEVQFDDDKEYLIINKYGEEIYCYDHDYSQLKIVANYGASEEERENKVLIAHATNPRLTADGKTLYDCDVDIVDAFDFIAANGYIVVEGSMIGNRKLLLTNVVEIDGTYYIVGIVSSAGKLYDVSLSNPVNTAASTLTVSEIKLNAGVTDLDRRVTTLENNLSELEYNYNVTAQDLANYKTTVNSYLATIQSNTNRIVNLEQRCTSLSSAIQTNLNSINGLANRITALEQNNRTIDKQLDRNSTNPVENKAIANKIADLEQRIGQGVEVDDALSPVSTNPVENKVIKLELDRLEDLIEELEPNIDTYRYDRDPMYPECYGAKGDGINYYDWPLACFNGFVNDEVEIEETESDIEIYAPGERIMFKYNSPNDKDYAGRDMSHLANEVVFNSAINKFLLLNDNKYYDKWANSSVWNDPHTGLARTDTVFNDIRELTLAEKSGYNYRGDDEVSPAEIIAFNDLGNLFPLADRRSYVFKSDIEEPTLVELYETMTDDSEALCEWFAANNGKTMKLRPCAIYYFRKGKKDGNLVPLGCNTANANDDSLTVQNMFTLNTHTTIIGNGATLFPHRIDPGWPCLRTAGSTPTTDNQEKGTSTRVFYLLHTHDVKITNVNIKTLRDKDGNTPDGSNSRFSTSSSNIVGLHSKEDDNTDIVVHNIEALNLSALFDVQLGSRFDIKNIKNYNAGNEGFGVSDSVFQNLDYTMTPYLGSDGKHMFYGGCYTKNTIVRDSKFVAPDPYREVVFSFHGGGTGSMPPVGTTYHMHFDNCVFECGGPIINGPTYGNFRQWWHFNNCAFIKKFDIYCNKNQLAASGHVIALNQGSFDFTNCYFYTRNGVVAAPEGSGKDSNVKYINVRVDTTKTTGLAEHLFSANIASASNKPSGYKNVVAKNISTNYKGVLGVIVDEKEEKEEDCPIRVSAPWNPKVGDKYYNITTGKRYICTAVGYPEVACITLNSSGTGAPWTGTQTLKFDDDEIITFNFDSIAGSVSAEVEILKALEKQGYSVYMESNTALAAGHASKPGSYCKHGNYVWYIVSKKQGNLTPSLTLINSTAANNPIKSIRPTTGDTPKSYNGTDPVWEEITD